MIKLVQTLRVALARATFPQELRFKTLNLEDMGDQEEDFSKEQHKKWSRRDVHAPLDMLHAFESGDLYDCTIRVGCDLQNPECSYKDFKCHKLVLSASSAVFETMFFSHFREAKIGPDDPISLDRIEPEVFETAMRFLYGAVTDFKSVTNGIKVFKFAQEMQITSLMTIGLVNFFDEAVQQDPQIFAVFDLYKNSGYHLGLNFKKILSEEACEALESDEWLKISSESVEEFLNFEGIYADEVDLLKALIRWGIYQMKQDGVYCEDGRNLRSKILFGLQLIRFNGLTKKEFAGLCLEKLGKVLSGDEKSSIFMSFITGDWNLMPTQFAPSNLAPRHMPYTLCDVKFQRDRKSDCYGHWSINSSLEFKVSKPVVFAGLKISMSEKYHESFQFELYMPCVHKTITGSSSQRLSSRGVKFCIISPLCKLVAGKTYCLRFILNEDCNYHEAYTLDLSLTRSTIFDGAILQIETTQLCAAVEALVFKKSGSTISGNQPG